MIGKIKLALICEIQSFMIDLLISACMCSAPKSNSFYISWENKI